MPKITTTAELKNAILELEYQQATEWPLLKEQFLTTCESLKLINILKATLKDAMVAPDLRSDLVNAAIGITTGIIAKKAVIGNTHNPLKKLLGVVVELAVANKVAKNTEGIRSIGSLFLKKIFTKRNDQRLL